MSLTEPLIAVPLSSTTSLDDLPIDNPRRDLSNRTMSLPHVKKRLQVFSRDSIKRRKVVRDSVVSFQLGDDQASLSATSPTPHDIKDQPTVTAVRRVPAPTRKRILVQQWLIQQSERFGRFRHRYDLVFRSENVQKELKLASGGVNSTVEGPHGDPLPAYVVEDFFKLYSAGVSDWRDSRRWVVHLWKWEDHTNDCLQGDCSYCRTMCRAGEGVPPPYVALSPPTLHARSPKSRVLAKSPVSPKRPEDGYFSIPLWRRRSRQHRKKGKAPALDEVCNSPVDEALISPQTHTQEYPPVRPRAPRALKSNIVIRDAVRCQQEKPVRCSYSSKPLDPRLIPVPAIPDLYPEDSGGLDLSKPSHITGRPNGASPLEEGRLLFPLTKNLPPPLIPELKPKQRLTPVPDSLQLEDSLRVFSDGALFNMSQSTSASPSATNIQRGGFESTIRLVHPSTTTQVSAFTTLMSQNHDGLPMPKTKKRRPAHRSPSPAVRPLPTPLDSRQNSATFPDGNPDVSFGRTGSLPARPMCIPEGPVDRDWKTCRLSDTTGSPLPDCPVYMNPREARDKRTASMAKRHWPGNRIWR